MMRIVRANNRAARRKRSCMTALRYAVGKREPFCYVEYKPRSDDEFWADLHYQYELYDRVAVDEYISKLTTVSKRVFLTYGKAIAHLTALKLNACEEDEEYKSLKPCKIVVGYYTVNGKKVIEKTQDLSDERNSMGRDDSSSGQLRQQRGGYFPIS